MSTRRTTLVFGPAYLDRVLKIDRPLVEGGVIDRSAPGRSETGSSPALTIVGLPEADWRIEPPPGWPGPSGTIRVGDHPGGRPARPVVGVAWHDDLGGMGAGYAKALGGTLHVLLGDESDPIARRVADRLGAAGIAHEATYAPGRLGEWTLLVTSGEHGDKLPIGFRDPGGHELAIARVDPCDLLVVASMTNRRASAALAAVEARVRLFAPAIRNMADREPPVSAFAKHIDVLCCNRAEWESLADREEVAWRVSILAVTDGPDGAEIRYTRPDGDAGQLSIPAFPRREPPRDTNRAGEAFASTLVTILLDAGWSPGTTDDGLIWTAAHRASAASALVLDRVDFGFPTADEIDAALRSGIV